MIVEVAWVRGLGGDCCGDMVWMRRWSGVLYGFEFWSRGWCWVSDEFIVVFASGILTDYNDACMVLNCQFLRSHCVVLVDCTESVPE